MVARAEVVTFPGFDVISTDAKLTVSGKVKKTHSNAKKGRSVRQDPFKDLNDVKRIIEYCDEMYNADISAKRNKRGAAWARNKLILTLGIFSGFRVSDLLSFRWEDLFFDDGSYRPYVSIVEQKTSKVKELVISEASKMYLEEYIRRIGKGRGYIFTNPSGNQLGRQTVDNFINDVTQHLGINGEYEEN